MIKKLYFLPVLLALILVTPVLAIDPPVSTKSAIRQEFQTKLAALKDEKKKALVTKLDARLNEINKKHTDLMFATIARLEEHLQKLQVRIDNAKTAGKETSSIQALLTSATSEITSARTTVSTQATKIYTINITTESALKTNFGTIRSTLAKDLNTTHRSVQTARSAVIDIIIALAKLVGEPITKEITK